MTCLCRKQKFAEHDLVEKTEREKIMRSVDEEIEREISKLQATVVARENESCRSQIASIEDECNRKLAASIAEKESIHQQLELIRQQISVCDSKRAQELKDWKSQLGNAEEQIEHLTRQLQESRSALHASQLRVADFEPLLKESNDAKLQLERDKQKLGDSLIQMRDDNRICNDNIAKIRMQLERLEAARKTIEGECETRCVQLKSSLERDHARAVAALQAQLADKCKEYNCAIESLKRQHESELKVLKERLDYVSRLCSFHKHRFLKHTFIEYCFRAS